MLFADNIVLCDETRDMIGGEAGEMERGIGEQRVKDQQNQLSDIHLLGEIVKRTEKFKYLGSHIEETAELKLEVNSKIQARWNSRKRMLGIWCDRRINVKLKGKVHKTVETCRDMWCRDMAMKKELQKENGCFKD
ncbi:uncharacterized protein [Palaemon carinicauda]|uniref:uncharacterized protein n=1 Tax=Palaemon carinicauda TaxID=392227 RepID=UPI0035B57399